MTIPLVDLSMQQREVNSEIRAGLDEVFASTSFIGGHQVTEFEAAYAAMVGASHCVGVANGTDALELALRAVEVGPNDEVILPANTFIATAEAVSRIGAKVVFVDVDPDHLLIDPAQVKNAISDRSRAIIPVHLFGQVAPMELLEPMISAENVCLVEDAAQAQGASRLGRNAGAIGMVAATSFYPGKNLGAAGDAGAVTTSDPEIARRVRVLGAHGSERRYDHEIVGMNSRLDTVQAVVLLAKLRRLADWNEQRREAAAYYDELLADIEQVERPRSAAGNVDVWHLYVIRVERRDRVLRSLHAAGIGAGVHYPTPLHLTGAYQHLGLATGRFPNAERAAGRILSLPIYPHITRSQQDLVVDVLRDALAEAEGSAA
jgi:dTDP-4-amino-4,6-dideoxygalactose transaminase